MQLITINSGKLRAIGYDRDKRTLQIEFDGGKRLEYSNIGESIWRNFKDSGNQWSFYRDNIEEEFTARPASKKTPTGGKNPLDDLFK